MVMISILSDVSLMRLVMLGMMIVMMDERDKMSVFSNTPVLVLF